MKPEVRRLLLLGVALLVVSRSAASMTRGSNPETLLLPVLGENTNDSQTSKIPVELSTTEKTVGPKSIARNAEAKPEGTKVETRNTEVGTGNTEAETKGTQIETEGTDVETEGTDVERKSAEADSKSSEAETKSTEVMHVTSIYTVPKRTETVAKHPEPQWKDYDWNPGDSDGTVRTADAVKSRHLRSAVTGGRGDRVFMDSTLSDYSLSWITNKAEDESGEVEDTSTENDIDNIASYTIGSSSSSLSTSSSSYPSSSEVASYYSVSLGDLVFAYPTISSREGTSTCCFGADAEDDAFPSPVDTQPKRRHRKQKRNKPFARDGAGEEVEDATYETVENVGDTNEEEREGAGEEEGVLYIGGIFELTQNPHTESARSELDAALLAIRHVNEKGVVPGYRLQLVYNDSKCDAGVGTDVFYDMIYRMAAGKRITMVMGSACVEVTKTLAEIVPYWNLILISYAATSPALGDREKYKTFFRLALADSALVPARRLFIKSFSWKTVAVLYEDMEMYSLAMNVVGEDFAHHNITITASLSFKDAQQEVPDQLSKLKELDVRIILAAFTTASARQVFCEAYHQGLYGPRYVWLVMGGVKTNWWRDYRGTNCTEEQLAAAVDGCFAVASLNTLLGNQKSVANLTTTEFIKAYQENNGSQPMGFFAATTYDTVWTIALTLGTAISQWRQANQSVPPLHALNYSDLSPIRDKYMDIIDNTDFLGVSGPVSFKGPDREGVSVIYQLQGGNFCRVAIHYPDSHELDFDCDGCRDIVWQGGRVPRDMKTVVPKQRTITAAIFYISAACCGAGILLALVFLQYNLYHRKLKYIKLSSPKLNNVAVIGCILVYATVVLMGLDDRTMPPDAFSVVCTVRVFLLAAGFSLAFGAMFAKTFRVHQIFTRAHHGLVKSKLLRDQHLLFLIGGLLVLDSGVVCVWVIVDPMRRHVTNLTMESAEDDEDLVFLTQLATCHSHHLQKWMGAFYAYKGLLLLFGVYMAWETRHVKIPALNDSQYIGFNVYNVVLMSVCVVVLSNILSSQPTLAYAIESAFMVLCTTVTLCLLFVPKIYVIVTSGGDPVIASTGILVEANTRRFVVDEKKEIYYRAEVQNRVYKRELVELDQEISRLERLLEIPVEDYPRLTEELLFLLPESKVDGTPAFQRRRRKELERCNSISDGGEGVSFEKDETQDVLGEMGVAKLNAHTHPPYGKRHSTAQELSHSSESTFKKLRRLSRSLSIGHSSHLRLLKVRGGAKSTGNVMSPKPGNHHWLSGRTGSRESVTADDDVSLAMPSPPLSPADAEKGSSRFSAVYTESADDCAKNMRRMMNDSEGVDDRTFTHPPAITVHVPTVDKITQTSLSESPVLLKQRVGNVYHVDRLEVIELEENPSAKKQNHSGSESNSPRTDSQIVSGACGVLDPMSADSTDVKSCAEDVSGNGKVPNPTRPKSLPTGEGSKPVCLKKGVVTFSPYNEIRFVDGSDVSESFRDDATASFNQSRRQTEPSTSQSDPTTEIDAPTRDVESALAKNRGLSNLRSAKSLIENERRKRIRKLQTDLLRIQKELQDLDELEYEITEV